MIEKATYSFLENLSLNNNKEWFRAHGAEYQAAKANFINLVEKVLEKITEFDHHLEGLNAEECVFRIYRDVRFLENKPPYKNHFSAYLAFEGRNSDYAGYYLQVKPNETILGGGMYKPGPAVLRKIRQEIDYNAEPLQEIISKSRFKELFGQISGQTLPTAPEGFPRDHENIELLKLDSFFLVHTVGDEVLQNNRAIDYIIDIFTEVYNFNKFFNETFVS